MFRQDYGGTSAVNKILKESRNPVILTANDAYSPKISSIRSRCEVVKFKKIHYATIKKKLAFVCEKEGVKCDEKLLEEMAKKEEGDLKSAITDLQAMVQGQNSLQEKDLELLGGRDREESVFNALRTIFKKQSFSRARQAFNSSGEDPDLFFKWVEENTPREYSGENLARAFESLSKADLYSARIRKRQDWSLMKYQIDLATGGVSIADAPGGFTPYQFPSLIKKLSSSKKQRGARDSVAEKIGEKLHASKNEVLTHHLPFLKQVFKQDPEGYSELFGFEDEEKKFLGLASKKRK
jgi:replication factor C large subunit